MTSSWIENWSYDSDTGNLDIETKDGATYTYGEVPEHIANDFEESDSLGSFHNSNLRNDYDCVRTN